METPLYNQQAEKVGTVNLPDSVFGLPMNKDLIFQIVTAQMANRRQTVAHTKDRSEVSGGGKKPWKQKGTGRARHGSIRSPIWKGGGVTFGPRKDRIFKKEINKKMARKALLTVLSSKVSDKEITVIDNLILENWKTKEMAKIIKNIAGLFAVSYGSMLIIVPEKGTDTILRAVKNIPKVDVTEAKNLNALDVIARRNVVILEKAVEVIKKSFKA